MGMDGGHCQWVIEKDDSQRVPEINILALSRTFQQARLKVIVSVGNL